MNKWRPIIIRFLCFDLKSDRRLRVIYMTNFAWLLCYRTLLLRTVRKPMYLALTLLLTSNYFHAKLGADLFNTCRINRTSLESSSGLRLTLRQNTCSIAFRILEYENRDTFVSLPKCVVTKLMQPIFKRGYNITTFLQLIGEITSAIVHSSPSKRCLTLS